jgi:hypothetical protein
MKTKSKTTWAVLLIAAALVVVLLLDIWQVFRLTSDLTRSAGRYHLESISGELESTISEAEKLGFSRILVPYANLGGLDKSKFKIEVIGLHKVEEALRELFG